MRLSKTVSMDSNTWSNIEKYKNLKALTDVSNALEELVIKGLKVK